jgi:hypothetical protein
MAGEKSDDIWGLIENTINMKLKDYEFVKREISIVRALDLKLLEEWQSEFFDTNLGKACIFSKNSIRGIIVVYVLAGRIQNISFGSNNEEDLIKLIGSFFVKSILDWL